MTPAELRSTLQQLGFNNRKAAAFLGVKERAVYRWLAGEHPVPTSVAILLQLMATKEFEI